MTQISRYLAPALLGATLIGLPQAAHAQDMDAVLERLQELLAEQTIELDWEDAAIDGDGAVLTGVTAGGPEGQTPLGDIVLSGVSETPEGYRIAEMTMESYVHGEDEFSLAMDGAVLTGVVLPNEGAGEAYGGMFFYETAELAELRASMGDAEIFVLTNFAITATPITDDQPMTFSGGAESFEADLSAIEDPNTAQTIERLGYEQIAGRFDTAGSWEPVEGRLAFERFDLTVDEGGLLGLSFDIGGYTTEFVRALNELQSAIGENAGENEAAGSMAMMGLMQQLTLHEADIYFEDDTLTSRVLELFAEDQGMRPQDVVNQAKAVLPFLLAQIGAPQLGTMIASSLSTYLDDPQSLRISARPAEPVPFALLAAGAMASPQALADQIGLQITANE
ncbi:MAG: hypothetical protein MEQ84_10205 [Mesorhizobium sp.]|nr:hypothetical protein [Mesorhizobium sp.]